MKKHLSIFVFALVFAGAALVRTAPAQGVVFKIPDDVFPMDWSKSGGFKGILMLRKESPAGIFVAYPNDGESIEELRERAAKSIAPMIIDDKGVKDLTFQKSSIPNHKGDAGGSALYYSYTNAADVVQILFYERVSNGKSLIYGYFARRRKTEKPESLKDTWANEKGQGVKIFEKFWKSIKE